MVDRTLPAWRRVLVVVAHPDDESFGLGAVIDAFGRAGATVQVHCLTHGEASTLGADDHADLGAVRAGELAAAARELGVGGTSLSAWPDGGLADCPSDELDAELESVIAAFDPDGLLVFDPSGVTGHPDHVAATELALRGAARHGLGVLGWTLPAAVCDELNAELGSALSGHHEIDLVIEVDRAAQHRAIAAHASQAVPGSVLWRRLELLGDTEHLRRLA